MKFNILGIILMMVAIWLGTLVGGMVAGWFGFAGGLFGALIVGFVVYVIWCLITGGSINLVNGVIFSVLVYLAQLLAGAVASAIGMTTAIVIYAITAFILSFLVGAVLGRGQGIATQPKKTRRRGPRRRR